MQRFIDRIREGLAQATGLERDELKIESPRDSKLGDLAFPCFPLARKLKQAPPKIAAELAEKVRIAGITTVATGPYLNFRIDRKELAETVLGEIQGAQENFGESKIGLGKTVVLDYSSPNIAKRFHVGHLRSTIIGAAVRRLHDALGYRTIGINHIGDWGSQFGKLVAAIDRWGDTVDLENDPLEALSTLYVRVNEEEKSDPELAEAGRAAFRELESGKQGHVRETWKHLTELSLQEFDRAYQRLGVTFDFVRGEAFYEPYLRSTIERIVEAGVAETSEGALVVSLEGFKEKMPPCLLEKSDGTTLYATRDLAAAFHRFEEFRFERCLYVVGSAQKLHFQQLKAVLKRMNLEWEPRLEHVDFGMLSLPGGKLSSRKGSVLLLDELLNRAVEEARKVIEDKNPDLTDADRIAEEVGIGAVIFNDLKRERIKDVVFEWSEVLSFEGETGPYVQYTHARLASILRKGAGREGSLDGSLLENAAPILLSLGRFPGVVRNAAENSEPSELAQFLLSLCREINSWLVPNKVLSEDPGLASSRLVLVRGAKICIRSGLRLLGVAAPEEM
jgi:arginyl-tRNA synthetase